MENEKDQSKVENNKAEDNQVHPLYIDNYIISSFKVESVEKEMFFQLQELTLQEHINLDPFRLV